ncbi:MAG: RNase J family beta-CASP ribonuclease [Candidatus Abawacabacteria bacterium]|nr:RNase J family beta-CASP ribonuclease [Candidatus Abawacabacteria bacterium]
MNLFTSWLKDKNSSPQQPKPNSTPTASQTPTPTHQQSSRPAQSQQPTHNQQPAAPKHGHQQPGQHSGSNRHQSQRHQQPRRHFGNQQPQRQFNANAPHSAQKQLPIPQLEAHKLRVITLGGLEEVGKNSIAFEYGNEAIIVDMGLQFPDENMHGINYCVADYSYFKGKEQNIKAVIVTHGHLDHIGGIPHVMPRLGANIPIYCSEMTAALIKKRQEDTRQSLNINTVKTEDTLRLGNFTIDFFRVNHSIPGSMGIVIGTPVGNLVHTGDWKVDLTPVNDEVIDFGKIARLSEKGVLAAFCDSTNAAQDGFQTSESAVKDPIESIFFKAKGRIIAGIIASNLERIQQVISLAEQYGRKVVVIGRTMVNNIAIARNLKYMKIAPHTIITTQEANRLRPEQVIIILTGAQGEKNAALLRAAKGEHRFVQIQPGDTVIFSSSIIPGNEQSVAQLMDKLYRLGAKAINYRMMEVHAGGHAKAGDTKLLLRILQPKYFIPIEGNHHLLCRHAEIAEKVGYDKKHIIIPDNGTIMEFDMQGNVNVLKPKAPHGLVAIDGLGMGDVSEDVLQERHILSQEGIVTVVLTCDRQKPQLRGEPEILTRGFIYVRGADILINEAKNIVRDTFNQHAPKLYPQNVAELKGLIQNSLQQHLFRKTEREPMIVPVIVQV